MVRSGDWCEGKEEELDATVSILTADLFLIPLSSVSDSNSPACIKVKMQIKNMSIIHCTASQKLTLTVWEAFNKFK